METLAIELLRRVPAAPRAPEGSGESELAEYRVFRPSAAQTFEVEKVGAGEYRVVGEAVDRLVARHDMENEEAQAHVEHRLRRMGVIEALRTAGFEPGDDVEIGGMVFELDPSAGF
jgi:GTP-binding protein